MALEKKYYSGSQVFDIIKELPDKEFLLMLNTFAKERGADVVDVVRCKDCEHYIYHDKRCGLLNHGVPNEFFCKLGERPKQISAEFAKLMREGEIQVRWKKNE